MDSIRVKRGLKQELPSSLPIGELAFCTDTRELYVGMGDNLPLKKVVDREVIEQCQELSSQLEHIVEIDIPNKLDKKRDKDVKITSNDLNMQDDGLKIQLNNLSKNVLEAMSGKTPILNRLEDASVTPNHTSFLETVHENLLNLSALSNGYINGETGEPNNDREDIKSTDFIKVIPGEPIYTTLTWQSGLYDASKNFLRALRPPTHYVVPDDVYYIRFAGVVNDTSQIVRGNSMLSNPRPYEDYEINIKDDKLVDSIFNSLSSKTLKNKQEINKLIPKGSIHSDLIDFVTPNRVNLFSLDYAEVGYVESDGTISKRNDCRLSDFIEICEGDFISTNATYHSGFYDENKKFVKQLKGYSGAPITPPVGEHIKYVRIAFGPEQWERGMIVRGKTLPSTYIAYDDYTKISPNTKFLEGISSELLKKDSFNTEVFKNVNQDLTLSPNQTTFFTETRQNLYDKSKISEGYVNSDGTLKVTESAKVYTSDFIKVNPGDVFWTNQTWQGGYYDKNKNFIRVNERSLIISIPEDNPENIGYIRVSGVNPDSAKVNKGNKELPYTPYELSELSFTDENHKKSIANDLATYLSADIGHKYKGLKWATIGDSITASSVSYHKHIANQTGVIVTNYGISGSRIAKVSGADCMTERIPSFDDDFDIITIKGGTNDWASRVPLGTMEDRELNTFYGACHVAFSSLVEKYPGKRIGVMTPMQRAGCSSTNLYEYVEVVKEVAKFYSLPCLDLYSSGGIHVDTPIIRDTYIPGGLHPNAEGHKLLARRILNFIESL